MDCTCSVCFDDPVCDWCAARIAAQVPTTRSSRFGCIDDGEQEGVGYPQWVTYDRSGTVWVYARDEHGSIWGRKHREGDLPPSCTADDAL